MPVLFGALAVALAAQTISPECRVIQAVVQHPALIAAFPTDMVSGSQLSGAISHLIVNASAHDEKELRRKVAEQRQVSWPADCLWQGLPDSSGVSRAFTRPIITESGKLALFALSGGGFPTASGYGQVCVVSLQGGQIHSGCDPLWVH